MSLFNYILLSLALSLKVQRIHQIYIDSHIIFFFHLNQKVISMLILKNQQLYINCLEYCQSTTQKYICYHPLLEMKLTRPAFSIFQLLRKYTTMEKPCPRHIIKHIDLTIWPWCWCMVTGLVCSEKFSSFSISFLVYLVRAIILHNKTTSRHHAFILKALGITY